jgi:hypothetical protein
VETQALARSWQARESETDQEMGTEGPLLLVGQQRQALITWKLYSALHSFIRIAVQASVHVFVVWNGNVFLVFILLSFSVNELWGL